VKHTHTHVRGVEGRARASRNSDGVFSAPSRCRSIVCLLALLHSPLHTTLQLRRHTETPIPYAFLLVVLLLVLSVGESERERESWSFVVIIFLSSCV